MLWGKALLLSTPIFTFKKEQAGTITHTVPARVCCLALGLKTIHKRHFYCIVFVHMAISTCDTQQVFLIDST